MLITVLLYLLFLWKYSEIHKGWIIFSCLISIAVSIKGEAFSLLTLLILIGLGKICVDIYDAGGK
jgi:hypothetical protein